MYVINILTLPLALWFIQWIFVEDIGNVTMECHVNKAFDYIVYLIKNKDLHLEFNYVFRDQFNRVPTWRVTHKSGCAT